MIGLLEGSAKIISVRAFALDSQSSHADINVYLKRNTLTVGSSIVISADIASAFNGGPSIMDNEVVELDLTPSSEETVDDGEMFHIAFHSTSATLNGFCDPRTFVQYFPGNAS